jgi:mitogen-activated protein kinase 1/3
MSTEEILPQGKQKVEVFGQAFIIDQHYEVGRVISSDSMYITVAALDRRTNTTVAIRKAVGYRHDRKYFLRELKLLSFFDHENILSIKDLTVLPRTASTLDVYFVTDLMETDLAQVISSRQVLTDQHLQFLTYQILRGIIHMHSAGVIHRHLVPREVLLNANCDLRICGLKFSCGIDRDYAGVDAGSEQDSTYPRLYRAPEDILGCTEHSSQIDVWSIGCILAEMIGRKPIFFGPSSSVQIKQIISVLGNPTDEDMTFISSPRTRDFVQKLPKQDKQSWSVLYPNSSTLAQDLLDKMLVFNPEKRWSAKQCMKHAYFRDLHYPEDEPTARTTFDWTFESEDLTEEKFKSLIYEETRKFHT